MKGKEKRSGGYHARAMAMIHVTDIEAAINFWRARSPQRDDASLAPPTRALAEVYGEMAFARASTIDDAALSAPALAAWLAWYETTPDTPCIAICSTSQGDAVCKGCGRSFEEVQRWTEMTPFEKRATWQRITRDGSAWRFTRYAERGA